MSTVLPRAGRDAPTGPGSRPRRWARTALTLLLVAAAVLAMRTFVAEPQRLASASMSPTLCTGDLVLVQHLLRGTPEPGDIVTFTSPGNQRETVKRVVATAGQQVRINDGKLLIDGTPVDESYVDLATVDSVYFGPVTVAPGAVFVMGDDREFSVDSRSFGSLPLDAIDGRVAARLIHGDCPIS